jgi:hypothetical protein
MIAVQRTLFGLVCGQMLLLAYTVTRGCYYQPLALLPLPILTMLSMNYFKKNFAEPSTRLSLERAREYDIISAIHHEQAMNGTDIVLPPYADAGVEARRRKFDKIAYRQPVLSELAAEPWMYRRGLNDDETVAVRGKLRRQNRYITRVTTEEERLGGLVSPIV